MGLQVFNCLQKVSDDKIYDVAIIGGGLAGLTLSVLLARQGFSIILIEKERYPFHKVCGEYISMESWDFLTKEIGLSPDEMNASDIRKLQVTSPAGISLTTGLGLGGFGISRYKLDNLLKEISEKEGVKIMEGCKAENAAFINGIFTVTTSLGDYRSVVCCGSWGKKSNLDVKWKRSFIYKLSERLDNYVGIKYHVTANLPKDLMMLHNFKDGYCGVSKIEDGKYCVCWFSKAKNLKKCGKSIDRTESEILSQNPYLKNLFSSMVKITDTLSISRVSLSNKNAVENNVLMLGDAAGMISPLCGNGMSMAMHSSKIASGEIAAFLHNKISREEMERNYTTIRKEIFGKRIQLGRILQYLFGRETATNLFVRIMKRSPYLTKKLINLTHGKPF